MQRNVRAIQTGGDQKRKIIRKFQEKIGKFVKTIWITQIMHEKYERKLLADLQDYENWRPSLSGLVQPCHFTEKKL